MRQYVLSDDEFESSGSDELQRKKVKGVICTFGAFMGLISTFGQINAFGTFQVWYSNNQLSNMSSSGISWIVSSQLCAFFLSVCYHFVNPISTNSHRAYFHFHSVGAGLAHREVV